MHFIFATRGHYAQVEQMKYDLMSQRFLWKRKDLSTGKVVYNWIYGMLRPIQLWEYIFPEKSPVFKQGTIIPTEDAEVGSVENAPEILRAFDVLNEEHFEPKALLPYVTMIRKKMGIKPIPTIKPEQTTPRQIHTHGISVIPIGLKDDDKKEYDFGFAGKFEQEGL